eukprot:31766-Eustigmatos_ZCMA.PRE.1
MHRDDVTLLLPIRRQQLLFILRRPLARPVHPPNPRIPPGGKLLLYGRVHDLILLRQCLRPEVTVPPQPLRRSEAVPTAPPIGR